MRLLVVDWDYFFPNPMGSAGALPEEWGLYDWAHRENPFMIERIWGTRASGFLHHGYELPRCKDYEGFWDRIRLSDEAVCLYGDSNLHAYSMNPYPLIEGAEKGQPWDKVTLVDAHHDCGYKGTYDQWVQQDEVTCENWMLSHYERGSALEVIHPAWREEVDNIEPEPLVPVDRRIDAGGMLPDVYDAVYVCRSGAWVPPWCDDQFTEFINALMAREADGAMVAEHPFNEWNHPRPDVLDEARDWAAQTAEVEAARAKK